jgi:transcriptional regulator with XRE-family HTH domain
VSGLYTAGQNHAASEPLGARLRALREKAGLPLRKPAAAAEMDPALLSKIENGRRPVTQEQLAALAGFYGIPLGPLEGRRIVEDLIRRHGDNPAFPQATAILREDAGEYHVKKMSAAASKLAKSVNKRRNSK